MAETIGLLVLTAATAGEATAAGSGIAGLGTLAATSISVGGLSVSLATAIGTAAIISVSIGLQYALRPDTPKPENGSQALKQAIPPRQMGYGRNRLAGSYMLFETAGTPPARSCDVVAFHSGPVSQIVSAYLSDDLCTLDHTLDSGAVCTVTATDTLDIRYISSVAIECRKGTPGQLGLVSFSSDPLISPIWNTSFVGNGIAYAGYICGSANDPSLFSQVYPRNRPELSLLVDCAPCFDPRDGTQSRSDPSTWKNSYNPVIQLIDYLTRVDGGMGLDYAEIIQPVVADWMAQATICDEVVGGVTRYESHGWFYFDNKPEDIISKLLSTCDGWLAPSGDGTLAIVVGKYAAPTTPAITEDVILGFGVTCGSVDEEMINQLDPTYTDPLQKYVSGQAAPIRDEDSIAQFGVKSRPLELTWVHEAAQVERLGARALLRLNPPKRGNLVTTLYGMRWLGQRWLRLQFPSVAGLEDCVIEVHDAQTDLMTGQVSFDWCLVDPDALAAL